MLAGVLLAIVAIGGGLTARHVFTMPGPLPAARNVVVPRGGAAQVAQALWDANVIASPLAFRLAMLATARDGRPHAAELAFPAHASLREVLTILRTARPVEHRLTIPEGLTARQVAALLDRAEALTGSVSLSDEATILPDTYSYEYGTTRAALLARAATAAGKVLAAAWANRDSGLPLASPREALILASIVERETAKPEERAHIAAVFLNRLRLACGYRPTPPWSMPRAAASARSIIR